MFLVFLIPAALLLLRMCLFRSNPTPIGDVDYMQYQLNAIASAKSAKHRDEIKRVVAIIKVKLPYFFHYDMRIDGSYCINGPPECDYIDGVWARGGGYDIIEETQHEVAPGSEVRKYTNGMSTN